MTHTHPATTITILPLLTLPIDATLNTTLPTQLIQPGHTLQTRPDLLLVDTLLIRPESLHFLDIPPHKTNLPLLQLPQNLVYTGVLGTAVFSARFTLLHQHT